MLLVLKKDIAASQLYQMKGSQICMCISRQQLVSRATVSQEVTEERLSIDRRWRLICFLSDNGVVWKDAAAFSGRHEGVNNEIIPTSILSCPLHRLP